MLFCALQQNVHTNQTFLLQSQLYIFLMRSSINIPSSIDNMVIKSHRRELHNKNCDLLNSGIIFLLSPHFYCIMSRTWLSQLFFPLHNRCADRKGNKEWKQYNDLCLKNNEGWNDQLKFWATDTQRHVPMEEKEEDMYTHLCTLTCIILMWQKSEFVAVRFWLELF